MIINKLFIFFQNINNKNRRLKVSFIGITLFINVIRFLKSFVFMKYLELNELGILTIISAVMGLFSIMQLGLLNGGYRIFSVNDPDKWKANNTIYSYFFVLLTAMLIGIMCYFLSGNLTIVKLAFVLLGCLMGMLALLNNWNRNLLVAEGDFNNINKIEIISTLISILLLVSVVFYNLYGALLVIFSKELVFYLTTIFKKRHYLPRKFILKYNDIKWILTFGLLPFLSGIVTMMSTQVETWCIAGFLNTEALGKFYLPMLYIKLFLLIPVAVNRIYFPTIMRNFVKGMFQEAKYTLKKYFVINAVVSVTAIVISFLFMHDVIKRFIPIHLIAIPYIWALIPGLVIFTLTQPLKLIFNGAVKQVPFLWSSGISLIFESGILFGLGFLGTLTLYKVAIIKSLAYIVFSVVLWLIYIKQKKSLWKVNIIERF
jgi:O-antigen/teichoic acid export membrane protein